MTESHRPDDVAVHNERSLKKLAWAIEASVGQFKLFLARCNYTSLRSQLVERLRELTSVEIRILELKTSEKTLYARIQAELDSEQPDALTVFGLESVGDLDELLSATNQVREEFRKNFHFPLVLWVNDEVMEKLLRLAPDFESWATTTEFVVATDEVIDFLKKTAQQFFEGNLSLTLEACQEIKLACQDLQSCEQVLDLELKASIESLLGFTEYHNSVNRNLDTALEHYQKSLQLWQQLSQLYQQRKILSEIALCYYLKTLQYRKLNCSNWQTRSKYLRQCFDFFEQAQRLDLLANSILIFGRILRRLQDWQQLQTLAQKALQLHQAENKPIELSLDYSFLAEVALANERWAEAKELAEKALEILSSVPTLQSSNSSGVVYELPDESVILYVPSFSRFILAQSQHHLDQAQEAVRNLEAAREGGNPEYDPYLYLDILDYLHRLYFEQKEYLKGFEIKLERQSIEQQYGFRAFVGASWIQPQRQAKFVLTQAASQEAVAPEITASGRQLDVERLIERIGRNDSKLIVIHGESGVGKSSLIYGGLVPALKQKSMGTSDVLPVAMRVYTSWVEQLGKLLAGLLEEKEINLTAPLDSEAAILEQLQQSESRNLRTVLIFDQFEEFFFVYPDPAERRRFFEFVGACLNILPVKVILSLRKDYLHYLLECNRLPSMKIISNDILTKNVLYELGNFSPADAKAIVQRLTDVSNFHLELALIEQLVQDLADNLGEVRPIELQIVGAQLQTDNITTLAEYRERGQKEELVKRYLAEVVSDCGAENKQAAELVLYLLTDEKGTRPLKTRAEVERDLQELATDSTAEASRLDLVLQIFVDSGLVVVLPELPSDRYQLVHDYLATFIRKQQATGLLAELAEAKKKQKLTEAQLKQALREKEKALRQEQQERQRVEIAEIEALSSLSQALLLSHDQLGALIASLKASKKLKEIETPLDIKIRAVDRLRQVVCEVQQRNCLQGHGNWVSSVSFSPDGKLIASASGDKTLKLWSLDGTLLNTIKGHSDSIESVSFSPDGQMIASTSWDKTVKLWNLSGSLLKTLEGHKEGVISVSFSPDGQMIASISDDGTMNLWSLEEGTLLKTLQAHSGSLRNVSFSPDGQMIASASQDQTVKLWSLDGTLLKTFQGHNARATSVSFSPDGQMIASGSDDKTIKLWSLDGTLLETLQGHKARVTTVSFHLDGQMIASGSDDKTIKLWSLDGTLLKTLQGHRAKVYSVSFSPDGQMIASGSDDKTIKLWSSNVMKIRTLQGHMKWVWSVSFSPDGQMIASASWDKTVKLWSIDGRLLRTLQGHSQLRGMSFSPDGKMIASASEDGTVKLWNVEGDDPLKTLVADSDSCNTVIFSPDAKMIASGGRDQTVKIWSLDGTLQNTLQGHMAKVYSVNFSPDGQMIVSGSEDGTIKLWNIDGTLCNTLEHSDSVASVSFSPDGQMIASASYDQTVKLWSIDGALCKTLVGHNASVNDVRFSSDSQTIASASWDNTIKLWNIDGTLLKTLHGHNSNVLSVSFSPDGKTIASASADHSVKLWSLDNQNLKTFALDDLLVRGCDWLRDYLKTNPNVSESDRHLCDNIKIQE